MLLSEAIRAEIVLHARAGHPNEACGLLAVDGDGRVRRAYCLDNVDRSPFSFTVDPDQHFASLIDAESNGWSLGGSFHSHPRTGAVPSQTDISRALEPDWVYLIVGLADPEIPELRGWWIRAGMAVEEPIEVVPVTEGVR
ncbi:MAG: M67 family metallopeptidase [Acidimicrobiia bacterium]